MEKWKENWYEGRKRWKTMPKWLRQELPDIKKSTAAAWIYRRYDISLREFFKDYPVWHWFVIDNSRYLLSQFTGSSSAVSVFAFPFKNQIGRTA